MANLSDHDQTAHETVRSVVPLEARLAAQLERATGPAFQGLLISDGCVACREQLLRLRCCAHLLRQAARMALSTDGHAADAGRHMLRMFERFAVPEEQEKPSPQCPAGGPAATPAVTNAKQAERLRRPCQRHHDAKHQALREVARELLNDWKAINAGEHGPLVH